MNLAKFVARLDGKDHAERLATVASYALGADDAAFAELFSGLWAGETHWRRLALLAAATRRDVERCWAGLDDPSVSVRALAAGYVGRYADAIPGDLVDRLDEATLKVLCGRVVRHERRAVAASLLAALLDRGRVGEAATLLPVCDRATHDRLLDSVAWPAELWPRLAKHQPDLMVARLDAAFAETDRPDLVWRRHRPDFWHGLAMRRPAAVAGWIDRYRDPDRLPGEVVAALTPLARFDPARVCGWLAALPRVSPHLLPAALIKRLRFVDDAALRPLCAGLAERAPFLLGRVLSRLPHVRRGQLFEAATADLETARTEWPLPLLGELPDWIRDREAARMGGLVQARTDDTVRRRLLGFRDVEAVRAELERECRRAQATDRAEGYDALIRSAGRSRKGMAATLQFAARIKNEQDPVRLAVLSALAQVPVRQLTDAEALDAVVTPIFDARDTSWATRRQATQVAHRLLVAHADDPDSPLFALGLSILERLAGQSGVADLPRLDTNLPRGAEHAIVAAVLPWIEAAQKRAQTRAVFALWFALGERAWNVPALVERVEHAVWKGPKAEAAHAASLWIADPKHRDERVRQLVRRDKSALYVHGVMWHCHRRRQTLLAPRFDLAAHRGRFHTLKVVPIPHFDRGLERWAPALQGKFESLLRAAMAEPKRFSTHRARLVHSLGRVPTVTVDAVLAAIRPGDVVELEAALGALVWNDRPAPALPVLLDHLDGDRARVAMYALPRLARLLPATTIVDALAGVLARDRIKITVHKEVIRLLGQYATPRALALLRAEWDKPLHRDVRIAALHAARSVLDEPLAWEILAAAATHPEADVARALVEVYAPNVPRVHQARYLRAMMAVADHPETAARNALFTSLASWSAAAPNEVVTLAARVLARLDVLDPVAPALDRVRAGARARSVHPAVITLVDALVASAAEDVEPAGERDQLARRRLIALVDALCGERHAQVLALLLAVSERLIEVPELWRSAVRARLAAAANAELGAAVTTLTALATTPTQRAQVAAAAGALAADAERGWTMPAALTAVDGASPAAAVAMVAVFGRLWGWGAAWTGRLAQLRRDPDLDVRTAALDVWVDLGG